MEGGDLRMSSVDNRVVEMEFNNKQFEAGVKETMGSLDALNKSLKMEGASKGLTDVANTVKGFTLGNIASGVEAISEKFKALSIIGITALTNIANKAINAGETMLHSLTVEPIKAGLEEYETNLNSIQTILSNTAWEHTGLNNVNDALNNLNKYSDLTIYNFSEMARNIGTFTAAGVKLQTSVDAIKGIANLAAISGSSSEQASTAMYQLSQALASGTVKLMDWNSVVNAGMGGKVFQDAIIETARVHGVSIDKMIKDDGSFRDTLQHGWLTSGILLETLKKFTGEYTASQLKAMGYNDQQIAGIIALGKNATDAATKIKTFSQLLNTLQESAGSGWSQTWQIIFGDFDEAKTLFTNVYNVLGGFITASSNARNKVLGDWKELGGRTVIITAIGNAFNDVIAILKPIKEAFRDIFPATTGKQLYDLTVTLEKFTENLKIGAETSDELKRTFAGLFAVLGIGWDIIKAVATTLFKLVGIATDGSGGFLKFTANVGDFLVNLREAEQKGQGLVNLIQAIGNVLAVPIKLIKTIATAIGTMFGNFDSDKATSGITDFASKLDIITTILNAIAHGGDELNQVIANLGEHLQPIALKIANFFQGIAPEVANAFRDIDWGTVLKTVNTGLFAGLLVLLKQFIDKFKGGGGETLGLKDLVGAVKEPFEEMTKTLSTMQNTLRAATLLEIAGAIALLTVSAVALSKIDSDGLTRSLTAMAVMFTQLFASMAIFNRIGGTSGFAKMPLVTGAMILLSVAINLLVIAVKNLSELNWEELSKGLTGLTIILGELIVTMRLMPNEGKLLSSAAGMILLAAAVSILVTAVTNLSGLSWEELGKGLTGVAGILTALALYTKFSDAEGGGVLAGAGLLLLAEGIKILSGAVLQMSGMSWGEIAKGLVTLAGALGIIVLALNLIPPTAVLGAAGVLVVAISLGKIADALEQMGKMSWGQILKGMVALTGALTLISAALILIPPTAPLGAAAILLTAMSLGMVADALEQMGKMSWGAIGKSMVELLGALTLIGVATTLMIAALPGAAALLVVAAALAVITPILMAMGGMSWEAIGKGLLTLAGVFAILGAAGLLLTPVVPTLLGLGVAIALIGVGTLAAGAGILALSVGLTALSVAGTAGAVAITAIVSAIVGLIPMAMTALAEGILQFSTVISTGGPQITAALVTVLLSLITAIGVVTPKIQETLAKMLLGMLEILLKYVPKMVDTGLKLLVGILTGIANNIHQVIDKATDVVLNFIKGVSDNLPRVIDAGIKLIINFVNGLANGIRNNTAAMHDAGWNLALAIIDGMTGGLASGISKVTQEAKKVAQAALNAAKNILGINSPSKAFEEVGKWSTKGLAQGFTKYSRFSTVAAESLAEESLIAMKKSFMAIKSTVPYGIDISPIVKPVLDLTDVQKGSDQIKRILSGSVTISAKTTDVQAQDASAGYNQNQSDLVEVSHAINAGDTTYIQNITSPKAVSASEIYRQTKNQLSKTKGDVAP
jgi:tape measure domain-containing protein